MIAVEIEHLCRRALCGGKTRNAMGDFGTKFFPIQIGRMAMDAEGLFEIRKI